MTIIKMEISPATQRSVWQTRFLHAISLESVFEWRCEKPAQEAKAIITRVKLCCVVYRALSCEPAHVELPPRDSGDNNLISTKILGQQR